MKNKLSCYKKNLLSLTVILSFFVSIANAAQQSSLIETIQADQLSTGSPLLAEPNITSADGTSALHWAVRGENVDAVQLLLEAGANASASNRYGVSPLYLAVTNGHLEIVELLIAAGANVNQALLEGETVLMTAARTGSGKIVGALLEHGADFEAREDYYGETALIWAAAENHPEIVIELLNAGAGINSRSTPTQFAREAAGLSILPKGNWTPLMYAARDGAFEAAETLVKNNADMDLLDPDNTTALVLAIINYHYDLAAMLLEYGADPNIADTSGMNALVAAVDMKSLPWTFGRPTRQAFAAEISAAELINLILNKGADPNTRLSKALLQRAHTYGDPAVGSGATAYMRAAKAADTETMSMLIEHGADPNFVMENGNTALMLAVGLGWRDGNMAVPTRDPGTEEEAIISILLCLEKGANINVVGAKGNTPLHVAATGRGSLKIIRFLLENGASPYALNDAGETPMAAALGGRRDRTAVAKLLSEAMDQQLLN